MNRAAWYCIGLVGGYATECLNVLPRPEAINHSILYAIAVVICFGIWMAIGFIGRYLSRHVRWQS